MRKLTAILFVGVSMHTAAQQNIDSLIHAEESFAAYAVANGTKDAFLKFADSAGTVFDKGQPVNAIAWWSTKEKRPGILNWHPQFAEIAASNDFGYTTGPYTFQPKTIHDSVVAKGQFTTVWHRNKNGEWKFLVDLGSGNLPAVDSQQTKKITASKTATHPIDLLSLVKAEEAFIKACKKNTQAAYQKFLAQQSILNRNSQLPATRATEQSKTIEATPQHISFAIYHSGIAASGDLGFVYGSATLNEKNENYLRIWRREKDGWRIALEALRY